MRCSRCYARPLWERRCTSDQSSPALPSGRTITSDTWPDAATVDEYGPLAFLPALVIPFLPERAQSFALGVLGLSVLAYTVIRGPALLAAGAAARMHGG